MGNSQYRYGSQQETVAALGEATWRRLKAQLERGNAAQCVDLRLFTNVVRCRFDEMVSACCLLCSPAAAV